MASSLPEKSSRPIKRFITTHTADGKTTFETPVKEDVEWERSNIGTDFFLAYTLTGFPAALTDDADLKTYTDHLVNKPPFMIPDGVVVRYCDFHPANEPMWHRSVTLDIGVCVEGELHLELESGEKRIMKRGDIAIQRGTNHCWINPSKTEFARALFIALDAKPVVINGQALGESMGKVA
jgi:quercetin dioxygenase-like cupin family protein